MPEHRHQPDASTEELLEAVTHIATCLAGAVHQLDPAAARRMNFTAGLLYNRLLAEEKHIAAEALFRFGRALLDRDQFPEPSSELDKEAV